MVEDKQSASRDIGNKVRDIGADWSVETVRRSGLVDLKIEINSDAESAYRVADFMSVLYEEFTVLQVRTKYSDLLVTVQFPN